MFTERPVTEEPVPAPAPARPEVRVPPGAWVRANLFGSPVNGALTVVFGLLLLWVAYRAVRFVAVTAEWAIVRANLTTFMLGRFPRDELWRPWVALAVLAATFGFAFGVAGRVATERARAEGVGGPPAGWAGQVRRFWPLVVLAAVVVALTRTVWPTVLLAGVAVVLAGGTAGGRRAPEWLRRLAPVVVVAGLVLAWQAMVAFGGVGWDGWGGLVLTAFVAVVGIVAAFPLGVLLALGRRSSLPVVRVVCVLYIEFVRGVPLISLLLMGQFMLGFFLPPGVQAPSLVVRALVVIVAFEAAYLAEVVRGGLQSVPRGQLEAAQALALRPWTATRLVVLPQALRAVIPAIVGQFISLYKDTSLLAIIGLFEVLAVAQAVTSQPQFLGQSLHSVTLTFVGLVYWAGCYAMSKESRRLERRLGVGER